MTSSNIPTSTETTIKNTTENAIESNTGSNTENIHGINNETQPNINQIEIHKMIIDEFHPEDGSYLRGPIIFGSSLSTKIQSFFGNHIENIYSSQTTRSGRFNNKTSSTLNNITNILKLNSSDLQEFETLETIKKLQESLNREEITEDLIRFHFHTGKISNKLLDSIGKKAQNSFLFVIVHCTHVQYGELIAIMKMERVFGVRYTARKLTEQLDLLPDKSKALQKGALVFKQCLIDYPVEDNYRENSLEDVYHTKFRDGQDDNISQYFMKGLLDNSIVFRDKDNTQAAIAQTKLFLSPYLKEECKPEEIRKYIVENLEFGKETSLSRIVADVISNSNLLNPQLIEDANEDSESLSNKIFQKMLDINPSSSAVFKAEYQKVDRVTFTDELSDGKGKYIKLSIAKSLISKGQVLLDIDLDNADIDTEDYTLIGFHSDVLNFNK